MKISFKDFSSQYLPPKYTCIGEKIMPTIKLEDVDKDTKSLALIIDDPDAVGNKTFIHMVLFNINPNTLEISSSTKGLYGANDLNEKKYCPACPPKNSGTHRYFFKVYALDKILDLKEGITKDILLKEIKDHIIEKKELIALFSQD
jgi:hypothetical protein